MIGLEHHCGLDQLKAGVFEQKEGFLGKEETKEEKTRRI